MSKTKIEWADVVWNPITGCTKVSAGCKNCYAERIAEQMVKRFGEGRGPFPYGFDLTTHEDRFKQPLTWADRNPRRCFVGSMTDIFQDQVRDETLDRMFDVMEEASAHNFLLLTKRPKRMRDYLTLRWMTSPPKHIWVGTSVESSMQLGRIEYLQRTPAALRFLSLEPLLGPITDLPLDGIGWVILGGESHDDPATIRTMAVAWALDIAKQVQFAGIPFLFKQWGGVSKCGCHGAWGCRVLMGEEYNQAPPMPSAQSRLL